METRKRVLGLEHLDTLTSMNNLVFTFKSRGRKEDAILLIEKCLQLGKQIFGPQHPYILSSLKALNKWRMDGDRTLKRFFFMGHVLIFPRYRIGGTI